MTSSSPRLLGERRIYRFIPAAALALAFLNPYLFSSRAALAGMAFGAQSKDAAPAPAQTPPAPSSPPTKQAPVKEAPTGNPRLNSVVKSTIALVVDAKTSEELVVKNADRVVPIASITKLMTAMVVLDAKLPMDEKLKISEDDRDLLMGTTSRLRVGWSFSREELLHLALTASENRAAAALSRYYSGGRPAFIEAMNAKAAELGMTKTHFVNPNGLNNENVSNAFDLAKLVRAADQYPLIREFTTDPRYNVRVGGYVLGYYNPDRLVGRPNWDIQVQKTGFTNQAGRCLVMWINAEGRELIMVFLDSYGKLTRFADARRVLMQLAVLEKK